MSRLTKTNIFDFQDHRPLLQQLLAEKKQSGRQNSLRSIAKKAGFSSPATISMIINGQRKLTLRSAEKLAGAFSLSGRNRKYFIQLSRVSSARNETERKREQDRLLRLKSNTSENLLGLMQYRFLSIWYFPVLYVLAGSKNFVRDDLKLAKRLGRGVTEKDVADAFRSLVALGLLSEENGKWKQENGALSTAEDVKNIAIYHYHRKMSELALEALDLPLSQREFNGLSVAIPLKVLPEVKDRIRNFRKEMNEFLSSFEDATDVYQFNIQLFPLTKSEETDPNAQK
jgi:uncharacterized protein (TIGR02147 family)